MSVNVAQSPFGPRSTGIRTVSRMGPSPMAGPAFAASSLAALGATEPPALDRLAAGGSVDRRAALKAAQQLVGETFFGMLLKELRKSTSKNHPLYGGRGEETMQPLLDQHLARRLAESRRFDLALAIAERLAGPLPQSNAAHAPDGDWRRP